MLNDVFVTVTNLLATGVVVSLVALVIALLAAVTELFIEKTPFEEPMKEFAAFYLKGFLPTMGFLAATFFILKLILGEK